jgi:hypothetical protein
MGALLWGRRASCTLINNNNLALMRLMQYRAGVVLSSRRVSGGQSQGAAIESHSDSNECRWTWFNVRRHKVAVSSNYYYNESFCFVHYWSRKTTAPGFPKARIEGTHVITRSLASPCAIPHPRVLAGVTCGRRSSEGSIADIALARSDTRLPKMNDRVSACVKLVSETGK